MLLHTSEDRWQAAELASLGRCFMCGRRDSVLDLPNAMSPEFKACPACVERHGKTKLEREADELLASLSDPMKRRQFANEIKQERRYYCARCKSELLVTANGEVGQLCNACWGAVVEALKDGR
jgi:hypothetical protein